MGVDDIVTMLVAIISSGVLNTLITHWITEKKKNNDKEEGVKEAARLLMKNELRSLCRAYIEQGWIYEDELEDLMAMHSCYHNDLNGNGFLNKQMTKVENLEVRGIGVR